MPSSSLKWFMLSVAMLFSVVNAADGDKSMVCGKPSIREVLKADSKDVSEQTWADMQKTATKQVTDMSKKVQNLNTALADLEAEIAEKRKEVVVPTLDDGECQSLVNSAFGGDGFPSAAEAKTIDCGYAMTIDMSKMGEYFAQWGPSVETFKQKAKEQIQDAGKTIKRTVFEEACYGLIGDSETSCGGLCDEFAEIAVDFKVTSSRALDGPTLADLLVEAEQKRDELEQAENEHEECVASVATINGLYTQFTKAAATLKRQKFSCGKTTRLLKTEEFRLKEVMVRFEAAEKKDKEAQDALREAIAAQDVALKKKDKAESNLRKWEEHMRKLLIRIQEQTAVVRKTREALLAADAAAEAVSDFKDKLSTALNGLVAYYDESVRQPLRSMGIREEVTIESLFPAPTDTLAAQNLRAGLAATKAFCAKKREHFEKLPEIEASGTKLTAICDSQDWDAVASEMDSVVNSRRQRAIQSLQSAQQKVVSYTGIVANKEAGEVEGVWKAMAIFGETNFGKNYLSGWKFESEGANKGAQAGFMMELARALLESQKKAKALFEEAEKKLAKLNEEKDQVTNILKMAQIFFEKAVKAYEKATEERIEADKKAAEARKALEIVTEEKKKIEENVAALNQRVIVLKASVERATTDLQNTHETAMGSFMELLHASEQQDGESWD